MTARAIAMAILLGLGLSFVRYLPSLDSMEGHGGTSGLPCFPLAMQRPALPGSQRSLNIMEPRYIRLYQDLLSQGARRVVVPHYVQSSRGTRLAEAAVVFHLTNLRDAPEGARYRYVCQHDVLKPVRIKRVLNPKDFLNKKSYLRVDCEEIKDTDSDLDFSKEEELLREDLHKLAFLSRQLPLRRFEYMSDSLGRCRLVDHGVPFMESALNLASPKRDSFWGVVQLWQDYVEKRCVALRQQQDRDLQELRAGGAGPERLAQLRAVHAAQRGPRPEAQALLQSNSHGERLRLLREALRSEARRLAALNAVAESIGQEAQA